MYISIIYIFICISHTFILYTLVFGYEEMHQFLPVDLAWFFNILDLHIFWGKLQKDQFFLNVFFGWGAFRWLWMALDEFDQQSLPKVHLVSVVPLSPRMCQWKMSPKVCHLFSWQAIRDVMSLSSIEPMAGIVWCGLWLWRPWHCRGWVKVASPSNPEDSSRDRLIWKISDIPQFPGFDMASNWCRISKHQQWFRNLVSSLPWRLGVDYRRRLKSC